MVPRGKAVAELMFGIWSYLTDDLHRHLTVHSRLPAILASRPRSTT